MIPARRVASRRVLAHATLVLATLVAGCSTTPSRDAEWSSPELGTDSALLRGTRVLVACEAPDVALRNICQEQVAGELKIRGAMPVFVDGATRIAPDRPLDEQLLTEARAASTRAIFVVALRPAGAAPASGFSFGIGGFGIGRGGAVGVGVEGPVGGTVVAYAANGRVTDVSTGHLVWSASATTAPSKDVRDQCSLLSATLLDSARQAGL